MGLGSLLAKIGGFAAAPFTGGMSIPIGQGIGKVADVLGGASKASQASNEKRDAIAAALANTQLNRDEFATAAPGKRMNTALKASLAKNYKPAAVQWGGPGSGLRGEIPQYTGGVHSIGPATQDPMAQQMMQMIQADELAQQKAGGVTGGKMDSNMQLPKNFGKTSVLDKILGGGSLITSLIGAMQGNPADGSNSTGD